MRWAYAAALLAFTSAAISLYWTSGGTALLDTVGGEIEELARERSAASIGLGAAAVAAKLAAGALALRLARPLPPRGLVGLALAGGILLALYGGVLVAVGALVLTGAVHASAEVDEHALRWHVLFWDLWFVVWGAALALAARAVRRRPRR